MRTRLALRLAVVVVGVVGCMAALSTPLFYSAERDARSCLREAEADPGSDLQRCYEAISALDEFRFVPWTAADSKASKLELERRASRVRYDRATVGLPDAAERKKAADAVFASEAPSGGVEAAPVLQLEHAGDLHDLARLLVAPRSDYERGLARFAIFRAGDRAEWARLFAGKMPGTSDGALEWAAATCLFADALEGKQRLAFLHRRGDSSPLNAARRVCVPDVAPSGAIGDRGASESPLDLAASVATRSVAVEYVSRPVDRRRALLGVFLNASGISAHSALMILYPGKPFGSDDPNDWVRPRGAMRGLDVLSEDPIADPGDFAAAADKLERFARELGDRPLDTSSHSLQLDVPARDAVREPVAWVRRGEWTLLLEAASEWARRGELEKVRAVLPRIDAIAHPRDRWAAAGIHELVGDEKGAADLLTSTIEAAAFHGFVRRDKAGADLFSAAVAEGVSPDALAPLSIEERHLLLQRSVELLALSGAWDALNTLLAQPDNATALTATERLALTLMSRGVVSAGPEHSAPQGRDKKWIELAMAAPPERPRLRQAIHRSRDPSACDVASLLAAYVVARGADDADPEVWLDTACSARPATLYAAKSARAFALARYRLARLLHAPRAEARWKQQLRRLQHSVRDGRSAVLARVAGI